jgi:hypothetical protein
MMNKLTFEELAAWCAKSGYRLNEWLPTLPVLEYRTEIALPSDLNSLTTFIDALVNLEKLIWVSEWNIWNDRSQDIGLRHLALLTNNTPASKDGAQSHVYLFSHSEWREAIATLTVPVLYGWEAYLFFGTGAALVNVSHDGLVDVSLRSGAEISHLQGWL